MATETIEFFRVVDFLEYMHGFNVDTKNLLIQANLSDKMLIQYQQDNAVPTHVFANLYHVSLAALPESIKEGYWGGGFTSRSFRLAAYAMVSAKDLRTALQRAHELHEIVNKEHPRISISSTQQLVRLTFHPATFKTNKKIKALKNPITPGLNLWHALLSWMIGQSIALNKVNIHLQTTPQKSIEKLKRALFTNEINFGGADSYFEFSDSFLKAPIVISAESLDHFLEYSPHQPMLLDPNTDSIEKQILSLIGDDFSRGLPSFEQLADRLELSTSALRRKLLKENTSYQAIKNQARKETAIELLTTTTLPVGTIADRTGFSEQGSFSRLFKQWTTMSPQQYRQQFSSHSQ